MLAGAVKIGILGGGQLGRFALHSNAHRMSVEAANRLNIPIVILDKQPNPAFMISNTADHIDAAFNDEHQILALAKKCNVMTIEIEHVNVDALDKVEKLDVRVHPAPSTIRTIQDKYLQKVELARRGLPISDFSCVDSILDIEHAAIRYGFPFLLKSRRLAYDGRGNFVVQCNNDIQIGYDTLGGGKVGLYVEKFVPFVKELAVMVARSTDGLVKSYSTVETIQQNNICHLVIAPAQIDHAIAEKARHIAEETAAGFLGAGVFGVEMFLVANGDLFLNEIAPRPHNSGHYTIEACHTSQFEQHIRAVAGLPLGSTDMKVGASIMINILGMGSSEQGLSDTLKPCVAALSQPGATVHLYGKDQCRPGRKMGHITVVGDTMSRVQQISQNIISSIKGTSAKFNIDPIVGIIMGSDSDLPVLKAAAEILKQFDVPFEISIVSAHRTPTRMIEYSKRAHERGIKVIIAAAGGAAHLPGMVAACTQLPVIGVPVALKHLEGVDSLYSIVQMPRGVPVATVAINNSANAALLAIRILACHDPLLIQKLVEFREKQEMIVLEKNNALEAIGWEKY